MNKKFFILIYLLQIMLVSCGDANETVTIVGYLYEDMPQCVYSDSAKELETILIDSDKSIETIYFLSPDKKYITSADYGDGSITLKKRGYTECKNCNHFSYKCEDFE